MSLIPLGILASSLPSGGNALTLISTQILSGTSASVTFSSIVAGSYKHLQLRYVANGDAASYRARLRFNSDTGNNYATHLLWGDGSAVNSAAASSTNQMALSMGYNTANVFQAGVVDILDAFNTSKNKTMRALGGVANSSKETSLTSGVWLNTAAITDINIRPDSGNFIIGSRFSLYGVV